MIRELFNYANSTIKNACCEYKSEGDDGFLWDAAPCSMVHNDRSFRAAYSLHHKLEWEIGNVEGSGRSLF
jgi:hypothetical protein